MADKIGIIDLGSNTFHLLIVEIEADHSFQTLIRKRVFVGLAENGIDQLSSGAISRGLDTLSIFKSHLEEYSVTNFKITGTAALRSAANRDEFISPAERLMGTKIEVIDGDREADLIFKGVALLHPLQGNYIIMDIGGGSVEFILIKNGAKYWSKSYNIGVGVLHNKFHHSEPMSKADISACISYLYTQLEALRSVVKGVKIDAIIGASGSFEVVESMNGNKISDSSIATVALQDYWSVSGRIIEASLEERKEMDGLPLSRVKLIVVAMILIDLVIEMANPKEILISPFALKEGLLSELNA